MNLKISKLPNLNKEKKEVEYVKNIYKIRIQSEADSFFINIFNIFNFFSLFIENWELENFKVHFYYLNSLLCLTTPKNK